MRDLSGAMPIALDVAASSLCTWRVGGPLKIVARPNTLDDLAALSRALPPAIPTLVIGRGSNLLVSDDGFHGLCIVLDGAFASLKISSSATDDDDDGDGVVVVGGGALPLPVLARRSAAAGISGLEFFVGIPGSVGGAVRMNAGGHGCETSDVVVECEVFDLVDATVRVLSATDAQFAYRSSIIGPSHVVTKARFRGTLATRSVCEARIDEVVAWRRAHQPGGANAGSVFANPPGDSAGRLIDTAGAKGLSVGNAEVSTKHANFIQANPGATARDVFQLIEDVRACVFAFHNIQLRSEVRCVGFEYPPDSPWELAK